MTRINAVLTIAALALSVSLVAAPQSQKQPPKGFTGLFNGKDLSGWRGRQPNYNPVEEAKLSPDEHKKKQAEWDAARDAHWKVDTAKQEIVSDGQSPHLATAKDYGDFEFYVDWLMVSKNGDSGIFLRGYPQVQVWDPDNPREVKNGAPKGSGALWNNNDDNPGKCPGDGWQLMAKQGQRGRDGPEGKRGPAGAIISGWIVAASASSLACARSRTADP